MARLLVVEDHNDLALGLRFNLQGAGHAVALARSAAEARAQLAERLPDLVILDLMLPDGSGLAVLESLRARGANVPVLILSAKGGPSEKVAGLRSGADDYLAKPFDLDELLARVEALLRRSAPAARATADEIRFGDVTVDVDGRRVVRRGTEIPLARKAFDLLCALASRPGSVVTRKELMERVWGYDEGASSRTLDAHIFELRQRLEEDPSAPRHLVTVRAVGYRFEP